jgi:hypothetical protein
MARITRHAPGSFCWVEGGTIDLPRTKAFYAELFGWGFDDRPAGEAGVYAIARLRGADIGGLYELPPALRQQGVPPHWMVYVAVRDADLGCARARELGGSVILPPFDVPSAGRVAVIADPTGAHLTLLAAKSHPGSGILGETGTPCWFELETSDLARAEAFYVALFGWALRRGTDGGLVYHEITNPGSPFPMGGMKELGPAGRGQRSLWRVYFMVDDVDRDARRVVDLGGKVLVPAQDIPCVGRFASVSDPAGATFSLFKMAEFEA